MNKGFSRFAWVVLAYNLPVILWGAYVRVSFSGDGCGANWPTCNGQVLPGEMTTPTLIEFTHRMMTSVDDTAGHSVRLGLPRLPQTPRGAALRRAFG